MFYKKENIYVKYTQIFFLALSYAASVSFYYNYSFLYSLIHISTKIRTKTSMVESFIDEFPGLTGSFDRYLEQLFFGEQVRTCFYRNDYTGDFISGNLKTCWAV